MMLPCYFSAVSNSKLTKVVEDINVAWNNITPFIANSDIMVSDCTHFNNIGVQQDAYSSLTNRVCFGGYHQMSVLVWGMPSGEQINQLEIVCTYDHQMSVQPGGRCPGLMSRRRELWNGWGEYATYPMMHVIYLAPPSHRQTTDVPLTGGKN